jgi:serine/threonine protein kinase
MNPDLNDPLADQLAPRMLVFDERLAEGSTAPGSALPPIEPGLQPLWQRLQHCMELLHRKYAQDPRGNTGVSSDMVSTPSVAPPIEGQTAELYDFLAPAHGPGELGWLGAYRVLKVLGAGGMGVVFLAEDPQLKRTVALKAMKPALAASTTARQRFLREAQATAALENDHIIPIYQVGEDRGVPYIAMPLLKGESLDQWLECGQSPTVAQVLRLGREIALGLAAAHAAGVIHRDIKPANLWLEASPGLAPGEGRVKVLDFGLARAVDDSSHLTQAGAITGTPAYMAPEQVRGETIDPRCDLFSLGCVLYRLCTGQLPFQAPTKMAMFVAITLDTPNPVGELNPALPPALAELVMQLLAKEPAHRPASAQQVVEAIQAIEKNLARTGNKPAVPARATASPLLVRRAWMVSAAVLLAGILLWGATVVLRARDSTLVLTTSEAGVSVVIDGEEKLIIDSTRAGKIELSPGPHRLTVKRGGEEVYATSFTLSSGGQKEIDARWEPNADTAQPRMNAPARPWTGSTRRR